VETIARSLQGDYLPEHLFNLKQVVELYEFYQEKVGDYYRKILEQLKFYDAAGSDQNRASGKQPASLVLRMSGVDLLSIDGLNTTSLDFHGSEID
jgi:hypothetical protein